MVNKYAQVALIAAEHIKNGMQPRTAWEHASCEIFRIPNKRLSQKCISGVIWAKCKRQEWYMPSPGSERIRTIKSPRLRFGILS